MGYALLAGLAAIVVLVSTAIFIGAGSGEGGLGEDSPQSRNPAAPASSGQWVGTWSAAPAAAEPRSRDGFAHMSIRNVVHTAVGGTQARIQLSNLFGNRPLTISHATIALAAAPSNPTAAAGSMRRLSFGNKPSVTIPAGGEVTSDAVRLNVPHAADLLVTTYSPTPSGPVTYHPYARQTSYVAGGDRTEDTSGTAFNQQSPYWRYLTAVDVWSNETDGAVAVLGDSITDGITSSPGANHRWTDFLAERLRTERGAPRLSVLNSGISGNRVLVDGSKFSPNNGPSGLTRVNRDVLSRTGVKVVVVEMGLNDIIKPPRQRDPVKIVNGLRDLVRQAHTRGLRVVGATLTPFGGHRGYTPRMDAVRRAVNEEIRAGKVFDAVVDFDAALRDPAHPERLRAAYDSGDHLHPSDNGYRAMAQALDLQTLKGSRPAKL
ncbi:SGNH/GDSL hydrolase family protein [Streptomyces tubbatahanensis]|uniref:SGNH/GDSL hydrolase family protein n=1 Tax=Streptomyces tubbatahanensis TaxID=2923272 RepID=A0ABY3Y2S2_9ACTN|nr:SGNH/GDSL hydrolase family protein [Streptomyces tubbatahanensis]UNT01001.1 SGNH/GDSL hydrolase family protein [Streptomyces tubbatahanensis]